MRIAELDACDDGLSVQALLRAEEAVHILQVVRAAAELAEGARGIERVAHLPELEHDEAA